MYVAITRSRNEFSVKNLEEEIGYRDWNKKMFERVYIYRKSSYGNPYFKVQVGLEGDIDEIRLIASPSNKNWGFRSKKEVDNNQKFFSKIHSPIKVGLIHQVGHGMNYSMAFGKQSKIDNFGGFTLTHNFGYMGSKFTIGLQKIINNHASGRTSRPVDNVYMIGAKTYVLSKNDIRLPSVYEPYSKTGFFLSPIVAGWAYVQTKPKSQGRYAR